MKYEEMIRIMEYLSLGCLFSINVQYFPPVMALASMLFYCRAVYFSLKYTGIIGKKKWGIE